MNLKKTIETPEFDEAWKIAFKGIKLTPEKRFSAGKKGEGSLWAYVNKPCPGVRRVSIEMGYTIPAVIYLRVWIDLSVTGLYEKFRTVPSPIILGQSTILFADQPPPANWESSLRKGGVKVFGVRYNVDNLTFLSQSSSTVAGLQRIGMEFSNWFAEILELNGSQLKHNAALPSPINSTDADMSDEETSIIEGTTEAENVIENDLRFSNLPHKTRKALVNARIGQGGYRRRMLELWDGQCAVTGCDIEQVLIASHAKPWRDCDVTECLDPYNGLPLVASLDKLFDKGLIAFADDGTLLKHSTISWGQLERIGVTPDDKLRVVHVFHHRFLAAHRAANGYSMES